MSLAAELRALDSEWLERTRPATSAYAPTPRDPWTDVAELLIAGFASIEAENPPGTGPPACGVCGKPARRSIHIEVSRTRVRTFHRCWEC